ncbi:MAG: chloramphenicol acetyltransferase, partial [Muribaculaceae bacterium]|nr:chloramphenicol acetyltransferase [Muribaculaceae bacterium]
VQYDIDGAVGMYSGIFNNPFMIWAKYRKEIIDGKPAITLKVSFQFHHTQMDGAHAATFLGLIQNEIDKL